MKHGKVEGPTPAQGGRLSTPLLDFNRVYTRKERSAMIKNFPVAIRRELRARIQVK